MPASPPHARRWLRVVWLLLFIAAACGWVRSRFAGDQICYECKSPISAGVRALGFAHGGGDFVLLWYDADPIPANAGGPRGWWHGSLTTFPARKTMPGFVTGIA